MKTIGLIGGTTWHSTVIYYTTINETIHDHLGKSHSAQIILYSIDFEELMVQHWEEWDVIAEAFTRIAHILQSAGADLLVLCANTPHKIADRIQKSIKIPLVHIADAIGAAIRQQGITHVGLLGTRYTMNEPFITQRLQDDYDLHVLIPDTKQQAVIETIIKDELTHNITTEASRNTYLCIIHSLVKQGAEGIILGCTEIPLLLHQCHTDIPLFDTTRLHARKAAHLAIS